MLWERWIFALLIAYCSAAGVHDDDFKDHPCDRDCSADLSSMTCKYKMSIETYATMTKACYMCPFVAEDCSKPHCVTADGFPRLIYTVNRQLPAPQIRVCEGDTIKVEIENHMANGEGTSIHWHGLHQMAMPYSDGVTMVTQCPIIPHTSYTYSFHAYPHGTHFYHSHTGMQRGDGIAGALVVQPQHDRQGALYDYDLPEHTLIMQDWYKNIVNNKGTLHLHSRDNNRPDDLIINGNAPELVTWPAWNSTDPQPDKKLPYSIFTVTNDKAYRFRLIGNQVMNCPIEVYIENHTMLVISTDGADIEPVQADLVIVSGGERWDIIVNATEPAGNYWMYFRGLTDCSQRKTQTVAVLHYEGASDTTPTSVPNSYDERPDNFIVVNPFNMGMVEPAENDTYYPISQLNSLDHTPYWLKDPPTTKVYLMLGLHFTNSPWNIPGVYGWTVAKELGVGGTALAQINRVHGAFPSVPYLSQYEDLPEDEICDHGSINMTYCAENFCHCVHRLKVAQGEVVELIMLDRGKHWNISNHPMHIHGQYLHIVGLGQHETLSVSTEQVMELENSGGISRNFDKPILKDSIMMPVGGYVIGRFRADNPGPWMLHCHNELHVEQGMSMVIAVGEPDTWPQNPNPSYKCGKYTPPRSEESEEEGNDMGQQISKGSNSEAPVVLLLSALVCIIFSSLPIS